MTMKYKISTFGYGGEIVMGFIPRDSFEYFAKKKIAVSEFATDDSYSLRIPERFKPFPNGQWYECDSIAHNNNVEMYYNSVITVEDENGTTIWESELDISELCETGCEVDNEKEIYTADYPNGTTVFIGKTIEKGEFFSGEFTINSNFDHKKLKFTTLDINGWVKLEKVEYNGIEIEDLNMGSTNTKDSSFEFEVSESQKDFTPHKFKKNQLSSWYPTAINPARHGLYEVEFSNGRPGSVLVYWNNSEFIEVDFYDSTQLLSPMRIQSIKHWRGLKSPS